MKSVNGWYHFVKYAWIRVFPDSFFPYKDRFCSDMGKYRSEKIRTLAYFIQCMFVCGVHLSAKLDSSYIRHTIKLSAFIFECVSRINICYIVTFIKCPPDTHIQMLNNLHSKILARCRWVSIYLPYLLGITVSLREITENM